MPGRSGPGVRTLASLLAVGCAVFAVLAVLVESAWAPLERLDADVAKTSDRWVRADSAREDVLRILSDWVWDPFAFRGVALVLCAWLWWRRRARRQVLWAAVALGAAVGTSGLCKVAFDRPRPQGMAVTGPGGSFPSGHVMTATVGAGVVVLLLLPYLSSRVRPWVYAAAAVSVVGVGFTRVVLGAHYLSDVVAGWFLGAAVLAASVAVFAWRGADPLVPPERR
ncbi:phosphatase PAP2 family protein [Streptomycetaceae bacterium NBC_01309]